MLGGLVELEVRILLTDQTDCSVRCPMWDGINPARTWGLSPPEHIEPLQHILVRRVHFAYQKNVEYLQSCNSVSRMDSIILIQMTVNLWDPLSRLNTDS